MKAFITLFFSLLILQSCDLQAPLIKRKYVLENGTERNVKVEFYSSAGVLQFSETINGKGTVLEKTTTNDNGDVLEPVAAFHWSDSAVATFNNEKRITYLFSQLGSVPPPRNILFNSSYVAESNELYRFTFTEEDYENAELIEE